MNSIFDNGEPSELSKTVCDERCVLPVRKPYDLRTEMGNELNKALWGVAIFAVAVVSGLLIASYTQSEVEYLGDVREVDGVLYYPDGQPVRNYEQLNVYLNSNGQ